MAWLVHLSDSWVVVDKPAGLLSVPGRGADKQDCAWARVRSAYDDALVVHRLDMATSGLLLFARGPAAQRAASRAFEQRAVRKRYVALVDGAPCGDAGEIELPLAADWPRRPLQKVDLVHGRPALTRWRVLAREVDGRTRVEFEPVTGRSHQLRVHAAASGWPIAGDTLYGRSGAPRLMLHASELELADPVDGTWRVFRAEAPF